MATNKSKTELMSMLASVAKLDRRGYTQYDIGTELGISQPSVSQYLRKVRESYKQSMEIDRQELIKEKLAQYREIRVEAWSAWERSKEDMARRVTEKGKPRATKITDTTNPELPPSANQVNGKKKKGPLDKPINGHRDSGSFDYALEKIRVILTKEGRLPVNAYLDTILKTLQAECELLGLNMPVKMDMNVATMDWTPLLNGSIPPIDPIEEAIANAGKKMLPVKGETK